ncbi:hypothetical protein BD779DRAFT_1571727 [Infundibulicybe gibba]|nr:hypothetical protein BD779DRAFT_1571727 [Infundibulicybe gibba]
MYKAGFVGVGKDMGAKGPGDQVLATRRVGEGRVCDAPSPADAPSLRVRVRCLPESPHSQMRRLFACGCAASPESPTDAPSLHVRVRHLLTRRCAVSSRAGALPPYLRVHVSSRTPYYVWGHSIHPKCERRRGERGGRWRVPSSFMRGEGVLPFAEGDMQMRRLLVRESAVLLRPRRRRVEYAYHIRRHGTLQPLEDVVGPPLVYR